MIVKIDTDGKEAWLSFSPDAPFSYDQGDTVPAEVISSMLAFVAHLSTKPPDGFVEE